VEPWLPFGPRADGDSVDAQRDADGSMLGLHRDLLRLRRAHPALTHGAYEAIEAHGSILVIRRRAGAERIAVMLNLEDAPASPPIPMDGVEPLLRIGAAEDGTLPPFGALVARLGPDMP
jgi:alpha-glucosidase